MPAPAPRPVATNRQAHRDYEILDTLEAGIMLRGSEVKSLREAKVQLGEAYAKIERGEVWLHGLSISPYSHSGVADSHVTDRSRKLLLNRREIDRLQLRLDQERLSLVALSIYFKDGRAKVEIGVGRGRKTYDKRQVIAKRDAERETARATTAQRRQRGGTRTSG